MAMSDDKDAETEIPPNVLFHYIKSNQFRVIHADGAYGGISPRGYIHFALYNERTAIPRTTSLDLVSSKAGVGTYGNEVRVDGRDGYVREIEIDVMMDIRAAKNLHEWLDEKIKEWEGTVKGGEETSHE